MHAQVGKVIRANGIYSTDLQVLATHSDLLRYDRIKQQKSRLDTSKYAYK